MSTMSKPETVRQQYADSKNLSVRASLHDKYSTNKTGLVPWLFTQYEFTEGCEILELGCGAGMQWENRIESLPCGNHLVLSDFSQGMVDTVSTKYAKYKNVSCIQIDIQAIPYPDDSFDFVIANHMLYHVPDLQKALQEVHRVLKKGGIFYCTTNGNGGMTGFLREALLHIDPNTDAFSQTFAFNLQNGAKLLHKNFASVIRHDYEDSLAITVTQDLIDWLESAASITDYSAERYSSALYDYFEAIRIKDGAINIPKECGLFIATK